MDDSKYLKVAQDLLKDPRIKLNLFDGHLRMDT